MENSRRIINKVQMGSRGGTKTTVQRFTLIFLLPLAKEYSRTLSSFEVNEYDW